jgi:riboflavin synthase
MFTGIIEQLGTVVRREPAGDSAVLTIWAPGIASDVRRGASVAVNGVCLTVVTAAAGPEADTMSFDLMAETLQRSTLGQLGPGDRVNLERAIRADARLDGHIVQGHVDGVGTVQRRTPGQHWEAVRFGLPAELARFVAEKGSVAVHGVSLTVTAVGADDAGDWFEVGLIPETMRSTTLGTARPGSRVNLETDVLARYVARLLETQ